MLLLSMFAKTIELALLAFSAWLSNDKQHRLPLCIC